MIDVKLFRRSQLRLFIFLPQRAIFEPRFIKFFVLMLLSLQKKMSGVFGVTGQQ